MKVKAITSITRNTIKMNTIHRDYSEFIKKTFDKNSVVYTVIAEMH